MSISEDVHHICRALIAPFVDLMAVSWLLCSAIILRQEHSLVWAKFR